MVMVVQVPGQERPATLGLVGTLREWKRKDSGTGGDC